MLNESLLSLGNGYLGVRGNFEEGYQDEFNTIRGTYINAFHDEIEIKYGEKLHAFPDIQQKLLNVIDGQGIQIYLDDERFSLFEGEVIDFQRTLHMDLGFSERFVHWQSPTGKEVKLTFKRLVSFTTKELFAINVEIEPISGVQQVKIVSTVNGDVSNFVDKNDPRVAAGNAKRLHIINVSQDEKYSVIKNRTYETKLDVACVTSTKIDSENVRYDSQVTESQIEEIYEFEANGIVHFTKYNVYTETLRHGEHVIEKGLEIQRKIAETSFIDLLKNQKEYLDNYWRQSDVKIEGDSQLQEGIRFNLYQLLQSVGKDPKSNIAAKGLSGEGYEGHYFWDTEIYMFPVFLMTHPEIAKNLLVHRYSLLDSARKRAKEMGHKKGALFPWRTITGQESSAFFPAGTAQYHISADIAYSYIQYYLVTQDESFLKDYMAEMLFETARLWNDTGHMQNGEFRIDSVTGPDEYTCVVNNNYYTNVMAKNNMSWAVKAFNLLKEQDENHLNELMNRLELSETEVTEWKNAAENMYLPYNEELKINAQDDSFLQKDRWDLENTPEDKFPLLLNYHPLTLYRYQVIKQADTVLAHFLLEDEQDLETIKNSYDYYEELTTHDSSLSCSIYGIMASKLGYDEKAYNYFIETARLDLDNTQGNTKDGLHMANMGGTWLALVYGFAGLRIKETGLYFAPTLPEAWQSLSFNLLYQGRILNIHLEKDAVTYTVVEGKGLTISHHGQSIHLENGVEAKAEIEYSS
ncbi:family 65 glycosyl hydrolase [Sporosarcina ureilytica]|uniref:Family 65 glycosyl hydrolase n=1 Tax=Sporosarcina ureilytica TaxID=298596 RepID=A0A1D8JKM6_9BACL|nr:family 65 glycosyl hydrolase [Sporosarcina ureilytica]